MLLFRSQRGGRRFDPALLHKQQVIRTRPHGQRSKCNRRLNNNGRAFFLIFVAGTWLEVYKVNHPTLPGGALSKETLI